MRVWVREKGGIMGIMLRRGGSSWLCMKFEFVFFACRGILIRVLLLSFFLALTVKILCLLFLPNPYVTSCFVLHILRIRFPSGIFMLFCRPLWDFLMRFHASGCLIFVWDFFVRVHALCYIICLWNFMLLGRYEICLWDSMLCVPYEISCGFRMSFHAFWPLPRRFPCEISLWDFMLFS